MNYAATFFFLLLAPTVNVDAAALRGSVSSEVPLAVEYTAEQLSSQITDLPGLPESGMGQRPFKMFSGYIAVNEEGEAPRSLFFWFVESQRDPASDPVVMWTNGGPGCSGLGGFFVESGPFRAGVGGKFLVPNPYSWNKVASMIYIEQPAGVGFSTIANSTDFQYSDDQAAADNYRFVRGFFERFPQYAKRAFYAAGESYAGHYVPMLAEQIAIQGVVPNFKGIMVGNPSTYLPYESEGTIEAMRGHSVISEPLHKRYVDNKCGEEQARQMADSSSPMTHICNKTTRRIWAPFQDGLDMYGSEFPFCTNELAMQMEKKLNLDLGKYSNSSTSSNTSSSLSSLSSLSGLSSMPAVSADGMSYFPQNYQPCAANFSYSTSYLNRADVQRAIHINSTSKVEWLDCNMKIGMKWNNSDRLTRSIVPVYQRLLAQNKYTILVYSGDDDLACPTKGTEKWIWSLGNGVEPIEGQEWQVWKSEGQVAGFNTLFHGKLRFVTVHGAGHMVPATRPAQSLGMFTRQLEGTW